MRGIRPLLLHLLLATQACAISLDDERPTEDPSQPDVAEGCRLMLSSNEGGFAGPLRSSQLGGEERWIGRSLDGDVVLLNPLPRVGCDVVLASEEIELLRPALAPLDFVEVDDQVLMYASEIVIEGGELRNRGVTVASGETLDSLVEADEPLWTGDRPPYGTALVTDESHIYAYGCLGARFLDADCYVARVPHSEASNRGAYEYWAGSERWVSDPDRAFPMLAAGIHLSVAHAVEIDRFVMAYSPPLSDKIVLRFGLGPAGPWSGPFEVARCAKPDADQGAFCDGVEVHADLGADDGSILLTYSLGSFDRTAPSEEYRSRLISIELPTDYP